MNKPLSPDQCARRGNAFYARDVRPSLSGSDEGKTVAIDLHTGAFAVAATSVAASKALLKKQPGSMIWFIRIGGRDQNQIGDRP